MPDIGYRTYGPLKYSERFRAVKGTHTRGLGTCVATPPVSQRSSALAEEPHHNTSLYAGVRPCSRCSPRLRPYGDSQLLGFPLFCPIGLTLGGGSLFRELRFLMCK